MLKTNILNSNEIKIDKEIAHNRPDIVIVDKRRKKA